MILPGSTTAISWASSSASSRYCVVRRIVVPSRTRSRMTSHSPRRQRGIEPGRGLVQEEDARPPGQGAGEVEATAHAARIGLDDPIGGVGQVELLE